MSYRRSSADARRVEGSSYEAAKQWSATYPGCVVDGKDIKKKSFNYFYLLIFFYVSSFQLFKYFFLVLRILYPLLMPLLVYLITQAYIFLLILLKLKINILNNYFYSSSGRSRAGPLVNNSSFPPFHSFHIEPITIALQSHHCALGYDGLIYVYTYKNRNMIKVNKNIKYFISYLYHLKECFIELAFKKIVLQNWLFYFSIQVMQEKTKVLQSYWAISRASR